MKISEKFWLGLFILLWAIVSTVSTIHSVDFFRLSNNNDILSWLLAISFEIGAMASLGGLFISRGNKTLIWILFVVLTLFQMHTNIYYVWVETKDISEWSKIFDITEEDINYQKRIFSFISGGILPLISLGFIKSLVDYLNIKNEKTSPEIKEEITLNKEVIEEPVIIEPVIEESIIEEPIIEPVIEEPVIIEEVKQKRKYNKKEKVIQEPFEKPKSNLALALLENNEIIKNKINNK